MITNAQQETTQNSVHDETHPVNQNEYRTQRNACGSSSDALQQAQELDPTGTHPSNKAEPNMPESKTKMSIQWLSQLFNIKSIVTFLALTYLILIPFRIVKKDNKFSLNEAGILAIVVLYNSNLIERLSQIRFEKNGVEIKLDKLHNNVIANRNASQRESQALGLIGIFIKNEKHRKKFFDVLLDGEQKTLEYLFESEASQAELPYSKTEDFEQQLRHLRALDFIESKTEYEINSIPNEGKDLRQYFRVSKLGKVCLALSSSYISPEVMDPECREISKEIMSEE